MGFPQPNTLVGAAGGALTGSYPNPTLALPLDGTGAAATTDVETFDVTGDTQLRHVVNADGKHEWGPGNAALDTNLYRSAADTLKTDDAMVVGGSGLSFDALSEPKFLWTGNPSFDAGIAPESGSSENDILNIGLNDTRFGQWLQSAQGAFLRFDQRAGSDVIQIHLRAAGGGAATSMISISAAGDVTLVNDVDLVLGTGAGTKIGTAVGQKLGFHNATPVVQRAGAAQAAVAATGATNITPFGYTTAAQADAIVTLLNEIRATLVEKGLMKGAA